MMTVRDNGTTGEWIVVVHLAGNNHVAQLELRERDQNMIPFFGRIESRRLVRWFRLNDDNE